MTTRSCAALDGNSAELFASAMRWAEPFWDEAAGLLRDAGDTRLTEPGHTVRGSAWYAIGLLMRNAAEDADRAWRVIDTVLNYQFDAPERPFHGTFARAPEEPYPPDDAVIWRDYDPNWREFIVTALALVLLEYPERVPDRLSTRLDVAIRNAVRGAQARGLSATYSNIALMHAFMLCFAGRRLDEPGWVADGERMGREVYRLFKMRDAFAEYNSPTYYGVNMYALALWRSYPFVSGLLAGLGAEMEALLWRDIALFYHAGLRNLAGPYDRSYGMDMRCYVAVIGLWMRLVLDQDAAPLPELDRRFEHRHDLGFVPLAAMLGARVPSDALAHLQTFQGERQVERVIADSPRRVASAWLGTDRMLGGEFTSLQPPASNQLHPATVHWRIGDGQTGWVRMLYRFPADARAARDRIEIATTGKIAFQVHAPGARAADLARDAWRLPGLTVRVETDASSMDVRDPAGFLEARYMVPTGQPLVCRLICEAAT